MSQLADLLELLHTAGTRYRTVRAVERTWSHRDRGAEARRRVESQSRGAVTSFTLGSGEPPEEHEAETRIWLEPPDRVRTESEWQTFVTDGRRRWVHGGGRTIFADDPTPGMAVGHSQLLDPAGLLGSVDLEIAGRGEGLGREAIVVIATPRPSARDSGFHGPDGADRIELLVDAERGVLLRLARLLDGEAYSVSELIEIAFDEDFPDGTFVFEPPEDSRVLTHDDLAGQHRMEHNLSIEEAGRLVSFGLWIPAEPPSRTMHVTYMAASEALRTVDTVWIHYEDGDLSLAEAAADHADRIQGSLVVRRGDTAVGLSSRTLGEAELERLAASLVPAPTERPTLG